MSTTARQYVVCIRAEASGDLEIRKLYERRSDSVAEARGLMRVVDESGEDYLYPADWFIAVELPREAVRMFGASPRRRSTATRASLGMQRAAPSRRR